MKYTSNSKAYPRKDYRNDTIYTFFIYEDISIVYNRIDYYVVDNSALKKLKDGSIDRMTYDAYLADLLTYARNLVSKDEYGVNEIYKEIVEIRDRYFTVSKDYDFKMSPVDQSSLFAELSKDRKVYLINKEKDNKEAVLFIDDLLKDHEVIDADDISEIEDEDGIILFISEEGLFDSRNLPVDSFVLCRPESYYTKPMLNYVGGYSFIYVKKNFDICEYVPLIKKSRLTYYHLYLMWKKYGKEIYDLSLEELYRKEPSLFINIYEKDFKNFAIDAKINEDFETDTNKAINDYLSKFKGTEYHRYYYDDKYNRAVPFKDRKNEGILVDTIRIKEASSSFILKGDGKNNLRELMKDRKGTYLMSNFLFFFTPKLKQFYNQLRKDRKYEQISFESGHLDYLKDESFESFPLYKKAALSYKDGSFEFYNPSLKEGYVLINDHKYEFKEENINSREDKDVLIYTPYISIDDEFSDQYVKEVGKGRINIVMIQDRIICIRKGGVLMPCCGAVLSIKDESLLDKMEYLEDGYYKPDVDFSIKLTQEDLCDKEYVYGGGIMLINKGTDYTLKSLEIEGWFSPLSRQTQDTAIEKPAKHPRTAIGMTKEKELVILVYSGRSDMSSGATYEEMIRICRDIYPDIEYLMNVDGGASSLLGMSIDGNFIELSLPATSSDNVLGMARNTNTAFVIKVE